MKKFVVLLVALSLALSLTGVVAAADAPLTRVRLSEVVRSIFYAPQYVALEKGFFEDEGLDIELSTAWGADKGAAALVSRSVDIGFFGPEAAVYVYQQGQEDYLVGFAQMTSRDGSFLMGRKPEPNFKWENLKGKTIVGARKGGVPEMTLEWILKEHGIDIKNDIELITNLAFTAAAGAFQSGVGDYVAQFEPTLSQMEAEGVGNFVASLGVDGGEITYTVYHARKQYLKDHPDVVQKFTNAIYRGQRWVDTHTSEEIVDAVTPFFPSVEKDILLKALERYKNQDSWRHTPVVSREGFNHLLEIMMEAGELQKPVDFDILMTNEFANKAAEE